VRCSRHLAYADRKPALDLKRYFDGMLDGWGMVQTVQGAAAPFVTMRASWQGDTGTLDEAFLWSDGERQRRVWILRQRAAATGTADDGRRGDRRVGRQCAELALRDGIARRWPSGCRLRRLDVLSRTVLLNRATMSKFGFDWASDSSLTRR
jgi:hypothetical protein